MVGINVPIPAPMAFHSLAAGNVTLRRFHMHGPEGVRFYTPQNLTTRWPTGTRSEAEFVMPTMG